MEFTARDWMEGCWGYVVLDLPFLLPENLGALGSHPAVKRRLVPTLVVGDGSKVELAIDVLRWSRAGIYRRTLDAQRAAVAALGRLYDFRMLFPEFTIEDHHDVNLLIWSYLFARLTVPTHVADRLIPTWEKVRLSTVMGEFAMFREFAKFSSADSESLFGKALRLDSRVFSAMPPVMPKASFFNHLRAQYERFVRLTGNDVGFPADLKRVAKRRGAKAKKEIVQLKSHEVAAIIDAENNPMFKALWILLAYVGSRISEALHLWICDVLPSSYAGHFGDFETDLPLIIFAHPADSTYCGNVAGPAANDNRTDFLKDRYTREPRTIPDDDTGEGAGFKGILIFDEARSLSWGTWIDTARAREFHRLTGEIRAIHQRTGSAKASPYFFVNSRRGKYAGLPMRKGNVEKAFTRACIRAGVARRGKLPSLHSLRHYYAWFARAVLKMRPEQIQIMMRHQSVDSNLDYGKQASELNQTVSNELNRRAA